MFSTRPSTGLCIISAILADLDTIISTKSCGDDTITTPSTGRDWKTVRGTSPVPGGMSTNSTSMSPQCTSVQNCFTTPAMTGPRQTTGSD